MFMWATVPVFAFAEATPTKTQLEDPTGSGTSEKDPLIKCGIDREGNSNDACGVNDINFLIMDILKLIFVFAGFIVAGMFMYAGFLLITAAGNTGQIQKAKDIFKRVVIGFLIMFLSYILIKNLLEHIGAIDFFKNLIK